MQCNKLCCVVGVSPAQLQKYGHIGCIDINAVLEPLEFILPKKEIPASSMLELPVNLISLTSTEAESVLVKKVECSETDASETLPTTYNTTPVNPTQPEIPDLEPSAGTTLNESSLNKQA